MDRPEFDPTSGQNLYAWILQRAAEERATLQSERMTRQILTAIDREAIRKFDSIIDAEDAKRLRMLRQVYGKPKR